MTLIAETSAAKSRFLHANVLWMVLGIGALIVAPHFVYSLFLVNFLCMALFAIAFNLLIGGGGLLSFGHAAFFGSGAYIAAEVAKMWGWPFEAAVLAAINNEPSAASPPTARPRSAAIDAGP